MGARSSRVNVNDWNWDEIEEVTGLSTEQIRKIQEDYFQSDNDKTFNINEFINVYVNLFGAERQTNLQDQAVRIFETLDRDRSGMLTFDEFLCAIIIMNHDIPRSDRIQYLVRQNNINRHQQGNENILSDYGHQVFRRLNDYYGVPPGNEHECWKQVDKQNLGYITQEEFMNYVSEQQAYNRRYQ